MTDDGQALAASENAFDIVILNDLGELPLPTVLWKASGHSDPPRVSTSATSILDVNAL